MKQKRLEHYTEEDAIAGRRAYTHLERNGEHRRIEIDHFYLMAQTEFEAAGKNPPIRTMPPFWQESLATLDEQVDFVLSREEILAISPPVKRLAYAGASAVVAAYHSLAGLFARQKGAFNPANEYQAANSWF